MSVQVIKLGRRDIPANNETTIAAKTCKNCGAPLRGNKCEYCGTEYECVKKGGKNEN